MPRRSSMSNFAAMSGSDSESLSPADKTTSKIIDVFSELDYAFWDIPVGLCIYFPLLLLQLRKMAKARHCDRSGVIAFRRCPEPLASSILSR